MKAKAECNSSSGSGNGNGNGKQSNATWPSVARDAKPGAQFIRSSCYIFNCSAQMADVQQTFQTTEINKRWKIAEIQQRNKNDDAHEMKN